MVLPSLAEAQTALNRVRDGEFFGDVAVEISTDASASRGGLLAPISRADPTYPQVMRDALWTLVPGETSTPILLSQQYAVLMLVAEIDGDGVTLEESRVEMERQVRLMQQRLLMNQKATQLLNEAAVTVIDAALKDSWDDRAFQIGQ
jgi:parvulin-like peptidyl-prolyl isomerase